MTQDEIDIMWQQAMQESIKDGEMFTRYQFAKLVAEKEREACIVDIQMHIPRFGRSTSEYQMAIRMIERIRARGQA